MLTVHCDQNNSYKKTINGFQVKKINEIRNVIFGLRQEKPCTKAEFHQIEHLMEFILSDNLAFTYLDNVLRCKQNFQKHLQDFELYKQNLHLQVKGLCMISFVFSLLYHMCYCIDSIESNHCSLPQLKWLLEYTHLQKCINPMLKNISQTSNLQEVWTIRVTCKFKLAPTNQIATTKAYDRPSYPLISLCFKKQ